MAAFTFAYVLQTANADEVAVGASSTQFSVLGMTTNGSVGQSLYQFVSSTNCWIAQGANPTASAAAGSCYVPAGAIVLLDGNAGAKLAVIEDSAAGKASLTPITRVA